MTSLVRALIATSILLMGLLACSGPASLPLAQDDAAALDRDKQAFIEALKPCRSGTPVIAVLGLNEGTEPTDLLLPHAVLQRAQVAKVQVVAPRRGVVELYPALQVEVAQDLAGFDRAYPSGADYVIVPAMEPDDDEAVTSWLKRQHGLGARIIAICSGARVAGNAGLLDGRRVAGYWYDRNTLLERHAGAIYVPHRRYVIDGDVRAPDMTARHSISMLAGASPTC